MTHTVGIFVFDAVEVLDFAGPYEVFTTASRMQARIDADAPPLFDVFTETLPKLDRSCPSVWCKSTAPRG